MNKSVWAVLLSGIYIVVFSSVTHAETISQAALLSVSCNACHGTDGKSSGAIPSIAGKDAAYLLKAMQEYRDGTRPSTVMQRHAKGYTDDDLKLIADYFANINLSNIK